MVCYSSPFPVDAEDESSDESILLQWYELPADYWYREVKPLTPDSCADVQLPIDENAVRKSARQQGMLLERLRNGRYRLWDIEGSVRGYERCPVPVDLTANGEFVDSLAGIAYFVQCLSGFERHEFR